MATAILTQMRRAIWSSINNYGPLDGEFKRKLYFEGKEALNLASLEPKLNDMPMIAVQPSGGSNPWAVNTMTEFNYAMEVWIWTPHWDLLAFERLFQLILQGFEQSSPVGSTQSYMDASNKPYIVGAFTRAPRVPIGDGGINFTVWTFQVMLRRKWGPGVENATLDKVTPL